MLLDYCPGCPCLDTTNKVFTLFLEEIKILMRLISPVHDPSLSFREDAGNKRAFPTIAFSEEYLIWNAMIDIKSTVRFGLFRIFFCNPPSASKVQHQSNYHQWILNPLIQRVLWEELLLPVYKDSQI